MKVIHPKISAKDRVKEFRQKQPIPELKRKAGKAIRYKTKIWTQEEFDLAEAEGYLMYKFFNNIN